MQSAINRYRWVQQQLETDSEYTALMQRLQKLDRVFLPFFASLSENDRNILTEYLGLRAELENRLLELACFAPDV